MSTLIANAQLFAVNAHEGQFRKYTGEPYWHHCRSVAEEVSLHLMIEGNFHSSHDNMVAAAWLHDTIEDTETTFDDIVTEFGLQIAIYVGELTDKFTTDKYPHLNRGRRKELECDRMKYVLWETKQIKLCDLIDNTKSIIKHDPKFAIVYLREKANLLEAMGFGNDN